MTVLTTPHTPSDAQRAAGPVIVVGYDGSPESRLAVSIAGERAGPDGVVIPVHVTPPLEAWSRAPLHHATLDWAFEGERRLLDEMASIDVGFAAVEPEVVDGDPARGLVRLAQLHCAAEIVVGSRGRGGIRALLGSVSRAVLATADRPVVVVPRAAVAQED